VVETAIFVEILPSDVAWASSVEGGDGSGIEWVDCESRYPPHWDVGYTIIACLADDHSRFVNTGVEDMWLE